MELFPVDYNRDYSIFLENRIEVYIYKISWINLKNVSLKI